MKLSNVKIQGRSKPTGVGEKPGRKRPLSDPRRQKHCETTLSKELADSDVPADRGACSSESASEGSE
jgi:hypothetical protein